MSRQPENWGGTNHYEINTSMPAPEQLFALTAVVAEFAKRQERLRSGRKYPNARFMRVEPVETVGYHEITDDTVGFEHKLVGHIRRIAPTRETPRRRWSLALGHSTWTTHATEKHTKGVAAVYRFAWDSETTHLAKRIVKILPTADPPSLEDMLNTMYISGDAADIEAAELQMRTVTADDYDMLETSIRNLCELSTNLQHRSA